MSKLHSAAIAAGSMVLVGWLTGLALVALVTGGVTYTLARGGKL